MYSCDNFILNFSVYCLVNLTYLRISNFNTSLPRQAVKSIIKKYNDQWRAHIVEVC